MSFGFRDSLKDIQKKKMETKPANPKTTKESVLQFYAGQYSDRN